MGSLDDPAFDLAQKILAHPLDASLFHSLDASRTTDDRTRARAFTYDALVQLKSALDAADAPEDFLAEANAIVGRRENLLELPFDMGSPDPLEPGAAGAQVGTSTTLRSSTSSWAPSTRERVRPPPVDLLRIRHLQGLHGGAVAPSRTCVTGRPGRRHGG